MTMQGDVQEMAGRLRAADEAFVLATVVRTVAATAAKAGAKAIIRADGRIAAGWIGGGCARGAVLAAARGALADGVPRVVSVRPENLLAELGVQPGDDRDGVRFARNTCPSRGTMDIFIEPVLPPPGVVVLGVSQVAVALLALARTLGFHATLVAPAADVPDEAVADCRLNACEQLPPTGGHRFVVVATQGRGDADALRAALALDANYHAFVGSRAKMAVLRARLLADGVAAARLDRVRAPAGLDLGAIMPEEIALSIFAEITAVRRLGQRSPRQA